MWLIFIQRLVLIAGNNQPRCLFAISLEWLDKPSSSGEFKFLSVVGKPDDFRVCFSTECRRIYCKDFPIEWLCASRDNFVAIVQIAQNWLKFGMSTLFVLKNVLGFFFQECRKRTTKLREIHPPPPPPPPLCLSPNIGRISIFEGQNTACLTLMGEVGWGLREGWWGVDFQERVWSLVSPFVCKKSHTDIS